MLLDEKTREKAFTAIVREYQETVYWQIRHMVINHDDADDLVQNTFMKAWAALDTFEARSQIKTWLVRIAINETLNFLQKKENQPGTSQELETDIVQRLQSDPYFDGNETQAMLQEAVHKLPEKQRLIFNMKYFQDMRYEEISQILGTSVGALKASYFHAVKKISAFFEDSD